MAEKRLHFRAMLLQAPRVEMNGKNVVIRLKRAAAVVYYLLVNKSATREELINLVWPEEAPETARRHLRDILHHLKKNVVLY